MLVKSWFYIVYEVVKLQVDYANQDLTEVTSLSCVCGMKHEILCVQLYDRKTTCQHFD